MLSSRNEERVAPCSDSFREYVVSVGGEEDDCVALGAGTASL